MRFLDIAVAAGYAAICLSLIVVVNPIAPREASAEAAAQTRLDAAISGYVGSVGMQFLTTAPSAALCESAFQASNATLAFEVFVPDSGCASPEPPRGALASSSLTLDLPGREVVVEAWLARQ